MSATKKITAGVVLLGVAAVVVAYACPRIARQYLPKEWCDTAGIKEVIIDSYTGSTVEPDEWADVVALRDKLRRMVDDRLTGTDADAVRNFLKLPENQLILAQFSLVNAELASEKAWEKDEKVYTENMKKLEDQLADLKKSSPVGVPPAEKKLAQQKSAQESLEAIQNELTKPHSLAQVISGPAPALIMQQLGNNLEWLSQMTSTGEYTRPGVAVAILGRIAQKYPDFNGNRTDRDIATATAIEFARHGWTQDDAVARADFYIRNRMDHRFNEMYDHLPFHHRRLLGGYKGMGKAARAALNDTVGSAANLQWSLDHVHLPADRYPGCCWQCGYRLRNIYGESVFGSAPFFENFLPIFPDQFNAVSYEAGGVCGGLSHFGASCALANGVPALTSAEPGHCSYIVLVGNKWVPSYSLSWQRGLHWHAVSGVIRYSQLHMVDRLFSPDETQQTQLSQAMRTLGDMYADTDRNKALEFYQGAAMAQPVNYYAWRDYARFLSSTAGQDAAAWVKLCQSVHERFAPAYPEMAAELLRTEVYPGLKVALGDDTEKLADTVSAFWKHVTMMGPAEDWDAGNHGRWAVEELADEQIKLLGVDPKKDGKGVEMFSKIARNAKDSSVYSPIILAWGNTLAEQASPGLRPAYTKVLVGNMGAGAGSDADRERMLKPLILNAEKMGDLNSFRSLAQALPEKYRQANAKGPLPDIQPFSGQLMSQGGMITVSHPHPSWNNACFHWGVLEPGVGGHFITEKVKDPWVKVTLPKQSYLSGVVIITTPESIRRMSHMKIQVSESGADNDWKDVVSDLGECRQQVMRVDLSSSKPRAKYVRILRSGGPEFFHLMAIYIYGTPAA